MLPMNARPGTNGGSVRVGLDVLADARAAVADAIGAEQVRRVGLLALAGEELVARDERARELRVVGRQPLIGVVERVAREELAARRQVVVDAALEEMLVEALVELEAVERRAVAEVRRRSAADIRSGTARPPG